MDTTMTMDTRTESTPLRRFAALLNSVLFHPTRYFRVELPRLSTSEAVAFGIGNAWVAGALAFFLQTFNSVVLAQIFEKWVQRLLASEDAFRLIEFSERGFIYDAGAIVLLPFIFLLRLFFGTIVLYLFSRLLVEDHPSAPEPVTFGSSLRIQATSYVGQWYSVVPFFGGFLAFLVGTVLQVTGVRERYNVSGRRAAAIVLAPYFLLILAALFLGVVAIFAVTQIPFEDLLDLDSLGFGFPKA